MPSEAEVSRSITNYELRITNYLITVGVAADLSLAVGFNFSPYVEKLKPNPLPVAGWIIVGKKLF
ncbi:MAG: hypothetical protein HWQ36_15655 [Nostoc sp. NMS2]|uniref:hypothetical protein n=1 Tax=Nostoc sp. NMS2 TaxID=2815389 RepID=UPI0025EDDE18|nr:hypothetical protein [Nostoc sp. NMS2]MBN3991926.1 hypothetical protein [Nostoc sp. NMS2]